METGFFDCHTHSEFSSCAEDVTLGGYRDIARTTTQGFAITDHSAQLFYPPDHRWGFWTDEAVELFEDCQSGGRERILDYLAAVRAVQCGGMLVGVELDVLPDGRCVFPEDLLPRLDLVLGAVHSMPALRHKRPLPEIYAQFRFQVEALVRYGMDVLAHPYRLLLAADVPVTNELLTWTVEYAAEAGFALEINSHKRYLEPDLAMARLCFAAGVPLAIGTDAHRWSEFGDFSYHVEVLERAGLCAERWSRHLWLPAPCRHEAAAE
ncbi:MAG: PHP domain-containing protein [Armatimonadota bacterium]